MERQAVNIILASKWFAWPPQIVKHVIDGLATLGDWIVIAIAWLTREFM